MSCKLRVMASALALVSSAYIPGLCQNAAPGLQGATNGTIGPKGRIETPLESNLGGVRPIHIAWPRSTRIPAHASAGKMVIENPLETSLRTAPTRIPAHASAGKLVIEHPLERSLRTGILTYPAMEAAQSSKGGIGNYLKTTLKPAGLTASEVHRTTFGTPGETALDPSAQRKERPGLVNWHHDFREACAASASTGKPVLLVHVLGHLDDHFC